MGRLTLRSYCYHCIPTDLYVDFHLRFICTSSCMAAFAASCIFAYGTKGWGILHTPALCTFDITFLSFDFHWRGVRGLLLTFGSALGDLPKVLSSSYFDVSFHHTNSTITNAFTLLAHWPLDSRTHIQMKKTAIKTISSNHARLREGWPTFSSNETDNKSRGRKHLLK
jgi:hypothetical protein